MTKKQPKTEDQVLAEMARRFDDKLLSILKNGKTVLNQNTGAVETVDPSAADLNVIRQRLKDRGLNQETAEEHPLAKKVAEMRANGSLRLAGGPLPPIDDDVDDLATRTA